MTTRLKMRAIFFLLLFGLAACGYFWYARSVESTRLPPALPSGESVVGIAKTNQDPYDITIEYTADGFVPRAIEIAAGTRVRFLNTSSEGTWPASGVHPTHTLYPEKHAADCLGSSFDSCRALDPGEYYDFTFYYEGRWPFHDHDHAYHSGFITVVAASTSTSQ